MKRIKSNPPKRTYDKVHGAVLALLNTLEEHHGIRIERLVIDRDGLPGNRGPLKPCATHIVTKEWHETYPE